MAQDATKTILTLGVVGVGGYLIYEYTQYQKAVTYFNQIDPGGGTAAQLEMTLPFMTYVMLNLGIGTATQAQASALGAFKQAIAGNVSMPPSPTPGTTPTMAQAQLPTNVSTTPSSTPTTTGATGGTATSGSMVSQPTAADLQHAINMTLATADQWNYAYHQLMSAGIDQVYGFGFDTVYGAVVNGVRSSGQLSAQGFLNAPVAAGFKPTTGVHGLGAIAHFYTPVTRSVGSMVYSAQHPSPYRQGHLNLSGFTQPTGFEMALLGRQTLRGNKLI